MKHSIPVLMYHHISPIIGDHTVHPDRFREQMKWIIESGIQPITGSQFQDYRTKFWKPTRKTVLITFDDGFLDNWYFALPILKQLKIPAIFFVVSSWPGDGPARCQSICEEHLNAPSHWDTVKKLDGGPACRDEVVMRWSELRVARDTGLVEIHSHSHTHGGRGPGVSNNRDYDILEALQEDLIESKRALKMNLGVDSSQLCWPFGRFSNAGIRLANSLGFKDQHSTLRGANKVGFQRRLIRRLHVKNRDISWFARQIRNYSNPIVADILGWLNQQLYYYRMLSNSRNNFNSLGFPFQWFSIK